MKFKSYCVNYQNAMNINTDNSETRQLRDIKQALHSLRSDLKNERITRNQFILQASESYIILEKLLRASALLELIEPGLLSSDQLIQYTHLIDSCNSSKSPPGQSCSLNMIVKNEEENIGNALDTIDVIMDEIVICDTGSVDGTVELAEQYGVTLIKDLWRNDFSRARNKAIEASRCDWIFWMDADDLLEDSSASKLQEVWQKGLIQAIVCCVTNERINNSPIEFLQVRLFPRLPDILFEQCVHEQVMYSIARKNIPFSVCPNIRIRHRGYLTHTVQREKSLRNKPMILAELEKRPKDPALLFSLGDCLMVVNEYEEALHAYLSVTKSDEAFEKNPDIFIQSHINCAILYINHGNPALAKVYLHRSLNLDKTRVEAHFALGQLYYNQKEFKKAVVYLLQSARIKPPLRMTAVDTMKIRLDSIYYLVEILIKWQRYGEAENILHPAIKANPLVPQFHRQMGKVLYDQNKLKNAARYFIASISLDSENNDESIRGMANIYKAIGDLKTAQKYRNKLLRN